MAIETHTALGDPVEKWRGITSVVVHAHAFGTQRIDQYEEDVRVFSIRKVSDVIDASQGSRIGIFGALGGQNGNVDLNERREIDRDCDRAGENPWPTFGEKGLRHGA